MDCDCVTDGSQLCDGLRARFGRISTALTFGGGSHYMCSDDRAESAHDGRVDGRTGGRANERTSERSSRRRSIWPFLSHDEDLLRGGIMRASDRSVPVLAHAGEPASNPRTDAMSPTFPRPHTIWVQHRRCHRSFAWLHAGRTQCKRRPDRPLVSVSGRRSSRRNVQIVDGLNLDERGRR